MSDGPGTSEPSPDGDRPVLLLAPAHRPPDDEACIDLLAGEDPAAANVVSVTLEATPDERLAVWQREVGDALPNRATVVDAGSGADPESQAVASDEFPRMDVDVLPEHADLMDLCLSIACTLGEWRSSEGRTVLCLHSLSTALRRFEPERVIGFVNGLNALCERLGVRAHHHLDPDGHDEETIATLRPLYGTVVEHVPDDGWIVSADDRSDAEPSFRETTAPPGGAARTDPERPETVPMPYSFDSVVDLISQPRRRTLLYVLRSCRCDQIPFDRLIDLVDERERSIPRRRSDRSRGDLEISLGHVHLPKLDDIGVVDYDAAGGVVRYHRNRGLESCVRYVETLELG
ncbi:DUF7504 family protein [Halobaculum roseum]|uniref:DUF7344 domain-containing protein n=1 Tax=Halobaculum roseum TaxID=2175149 RepID=A0ABD5MIB7_9EURY|nr:hypothetical protein [Halobaculum roseum]QZY02674.1 hypothetical protein K6T36_00295 [Halobaculum roseum]